jgi:hypothetical protein
MSGFSLSLPFPTVRTWVAVAVVFLVAVPVGGKRRPHDAVRKAERKAVHKAVRKANATVYAECT